MPAPAGGVAGGGIKLAAMPDPIPDPAAPAPSAAAVRPTLPAIFLAFASASLSGFGGALPWVWRTVVEKRRWMTQQEFNEALSLAQFIPGANALNLAVVFGSRARGPVGSLVAFCGLMAPPLVIVIVLAALYDRYGDIAVLSRILAGVSAAAAGLIIAFVAKTIQPLLKRRDWTVGVALVGFVSVAIVQWPLPVVFVVLAPISISLAWFKR